ncbi:MAG: hypothetical protein OQL09_01225 [Gammaproteobacteria bacterium]|nr:hypothetical protein [Gammaproteobacteria bacterium]
MPDGLLSGMILPLLAYTAAILAQMIPASKMTWSGFVQVGEFFGQNKNLGKDNNDERRITSGVLSQIQSLDCFSRHQCSNRKHREQH